MNHLLLEAAAEGGTGSSLSFFLPLILIFVVMYFLMIRPQKKREKETQAMRSNVEVGDEIVTIGGVIGRVVNLREDSLLIETGSDRVKMRISRWAVQTNNTAAERAAAAKAESGKNK